MEEKKRGLLAQGAEEEQESQEYEAAEMPEEDMGEGEEEDGEETGPKGPRDIADELSGKIPEQFQEAFARVVKAGMTVMFDENMHKFMIQELEKEGDIGENAGKAVAGLMMLLFKKSNGTMPQQVIIPAGIYLLMEGADFIEQVTGEQFSPADIGNAVEVFIMEMATAVGVDPERLRASTEKLAAGGYGK